MSAIKGVRANSSDSDNDKSRRKKRVYTMFAESLSSNYIKMEVDARGKAYHFSQVRQNVVHTSDGR